METVFNYRKTYYKVTNRTETHHGYKYKDGLNILNEPFNDNPNASCCRGGFYFTEYKNLPNFLDYGIYIRKIKIPKDARVIKDPEGDKWRCDKIILGEKYHVFNDFKLWFDKKSFDYDKYSITLAIRFSKYFDIWWDSDKFNWKYSHYLAEYCSEHFDKWWDKKKYKKRGYYYLALYCSKHFDKWWNPDKFNLEDTQGLAKRCSKHFEKWWNPDKYDWSKCMYLAQYCSKYFDKWWNPDRYIWLFSDYLVKYCSKHFLKWWDKNKFMRQYDYLLNIHCKEYEHIWKEDLGLK